MAISVLTAGGERTFADALAVRPDGEDDMEVVDAVRVTPSLAPIAGKSAEVMVLDDDLPGGAANRLCEAVSGADDSPP